MLHNTNVHMTPWGSSQNADSDSAGLGWGPRFCIFNELRGDADAAGPWTTLGNERVTNTLHVSIQRGGMNQLTQTSGHHILYYQHRSFRRFICQIKGSSTFQKYFQRPVSDHPPFPPGSFTQRVFDFRDSRGL